MHLNKVIEYLIAMYAGIYILTLVQVLQLELHLRPTGTDLHLYQLQH